MKNLGRRCTLLLSALLVTILMIAPAKGESAQRGPSGCPPMVGLTTEEVTKSWVCFTLAEEGKRQKIDIRNDAELAELRLKKPKKLWWTNVGVEYLPNLEEENVKPYAIGGLKVGPVNLWGGFFGDDPAIGMGLDLLEVFD